MPRLNVSVCGWMALVAILFACRETKNQVGVPAADEDYLVIIETPSGTMKAILYDLTPAHKANFVKLASEGFYDGTLFHRVIKGFMAQGGDPTSRGAAPGETLGRGDPGYTIPAEFYPGLYHVKGALAAARRPDQVNPQKASNGSQFYIVQGRVFPEAELRQVRTNFPLLYQYFDSLLQQPNAGELVQQVGLLQQQGDQQALISLILSYKDSLSRKYGVTMETPVSAEELELYTTQGGYPSLDREYSVFGRVVEGLAVLDQIAAVQTDAANRPLEDIPMQVRLEIVKRSFLQEKYGKHYMP